MANRHLCQIVADDAAAADAAVMQTQSVSASVRRSRCLFTVNGTERNGNEIARGEGRRRQLVGQQRDAAPQRRSPFVAFRRKKRNLCLMLAAQSSFHALISESPFLSRVWKKGRSVRLRQLTLLEKDPLRSFVREKEHFLLPLLSRTKATKALPLSAVPSFLPSVREEHTKEVEWSVIQRLQYVQGDTAGFGKGAINLFSGLQSVGSLCALC